MELLAAVMILGIMGSVALAALGNHNQVVRDNHDRRNAQEMSSVCACASAAGYDFVVSADVESTIRSLVAGGSPTSGLFKNHVFKVTLFEEADILGVMRFLKIDKGQLVVRHDI